MANINRIVSMCLLTMLAVIASPGRAETYCNPVVDPLASDTTLVRTLSRIAEEYDFKLSIHESLDRPVRFNKSMTLARLIKHLTANMSTVLKHKKVDDCASPVITHLIVLPVGKETALVSDQQLAQEQPVGYIYIDDMESYVTNVLAGKQQAELDRMTPEQLEEYKLVRDALATQAGEELSRTQQSTNTGASDTNTPGQASGEITGN